MKDLYSVLGIDVNASPNDVREAYRKLSKKFHPDLNENDPYFETRFKEIREAYELLNDPVGRAAYDNQLKNFKGYASVASTQPKMLTKGSVSTKINWAFTAILLVITALFGYYVVRSVTHTKATKVAAATSEVATTTTVNHHKKHHHKKATPLQAEVAKAAVKSKPLGDTVSAKIVKPSVAKSSAPAIAVVAKAKTAVAAVSQPQPVQVQSTTVVSAKPAQQGIVTAPIPKPTPAITVSNPTPAVSAAYIKANATGVVYMRQMSNYNSDVVSVIPGDARIAVLEKGGNFCKISYNNKTGYVPNWTVQYR